MKFVHHISLLWVLCAFAGTAVADDLIVFPNDGQSKEQQEADEFSCYRWAKDESGFDPMAPPTATAPPPAEEPKKGGTGRGLLRGAAIGGIVDGSDGAKTGAAAGAAMGTMRRNDQRRKQEAAQAQWEQEQVAIYTENRNRYNRGYAACMEAKNYTVR